MYEHLHRAFKVAGSVGSWRRATSGILQGCPLLVILVNGLTTIWKSQIDLLRLQVCVATAVLRPALEDVHSENERDPA